jgi:hypothetical protein
MKMGYIKYSLVIGALFVSVSIAPHARAISDPSSLLIQSIQVGSATDATDESIKIVNVGSQSIDLKGLSIEYKSATGVSWAKKGVVGEGHTLSPGASLVAASKQAHDIPLTAGLAQTGGNLRLVFVSKVLDQVAWGTGDSPEGKVLAAPAVGQILERRCESACQDTNDNSVDFASSAVAAVTTESEAVASTTSATAYSIEITELLPDPASPQTDARDEFIEIHNAGDETALLNSWKLVSGKQSYKLDGVQLAPDQYLALDSATTKLGLTNTGDTVSLLDASGNEVMATPNYAAAKSGKSYGVTDGGWAWLDHPTPSAVNAGVLIEEATPEKTAKAAVKKAAATKKATATAKATSAKSVSSAVKDAAKSTSTEGDSEPSSSFSSGWVLAILGIFAIGYGVYEYRPELLSLYARLRAKSQAGREPIKNPPAGRRR